MSEKPKKDDAQKHSKERREVIKAATTFALLPYVPPVIKTFLVDGDINMLAPQGQRGRALAAFRAAIQAFRSGLRGQALIQAIQNLVSP